MRVWSLWTAANQHNVHDRRVKMVVVVRADLGMGRGKAAAQVAHAAVAATLTAAGSPRLSAWLADGQPKVVVRVDSAEELDRVVAAAHAARLPVETIADAGRTQLDPGTVTCAAIGPADDEALDAVTGPLRLY
jgi:PTH2 family peptidyl-tRNA hydrolase